jgi:hypothetical protein
MKTLSRRDADDNVLESAVQLGPEVTVRALGPQQLQQEKGYPVHHTCGTHSPVLGSRRRRIPCRGSHSNPFCMPQLQEALLDRSRVQDPREAALDT